MKIRKILGWIGILTMTFGSVFAIDVAGSATTVGSSGRLTETTAGSATAVGGNVTSVNVDTNMSTLKWQGFYGTVDGNVSLGVDDDIFYGFGAATFDTIYVTTNNALDWSNLRASTAAAIDTAWSFSDADHVDQAVDVFVGTDSFGGIASVPSADIGSFKMGLLDDGGGSAKANMAFAGQIQNPAVAGFDGSNYNYQVMVPVNGASTETYYFYVSLD